MADDDARANASAGRAGSAQPPGVVAADRFMETIDQTSVIGTTSATANPWRSYKRSWARFEGSAERIVSR